MTNLLILLALIFGHVLQRIFYGPLRATEIEQIYEKAWYAVTETCLAMTIFRDEFDVRFIIMFGVLLFVKCFSWIGAGRVEFMEQQPPERPVLFHIRLASSLLLLAAGCGGLVWHAITSVLERGKPNMMVSGRERVCGEGNCADEVGAGHVCVRVCHTAYHEYWHIVALCLELDGEVDPIQGSATKEGDSAY